MDLHARMQWMGAISAGSHTRPVAGHAVYYARHRPEQTLLYQVVEEYYPAFLNQMAIQGTTLPEYVQRDFDDYLKCGRLEYGFLRVRCTGCHQEQLVAFSCKRRGFCPSCGARRMADSAALLVDEVLPEVPLRQWVLSFPFPLRFLFASRPAVMGQVLGIVYRAIATHLIKKASDTKTTAQTGAVTLIQRFGSALNLNIHFHMLFLDGAYRNTDTGSPRFQWVSAPTAAELSQLTHTLAQRIGRFLERQGLLERDTENSYLALEALDDGPMSQIQGRSIAYRIAVGPQQGRKVFTLQTLPAREPYESFTDGLGKVSGFSLHAGVATKAHQRNKLECLCRYIARPAVSEKRLSLTPHGHPLATPVNRDERIPAIIPPFSNCLPFARPLCALGSR